MLWLLVPGILLVLYRTRKTLMAAVFILVATGVVAAVQAALWRRAGKCRGANPGAKPGAVFCGLHAH